MNTGEMPGARDGDCSGEKLSWLRRAPRGQACYCAEESKRTTSSSDEGGTAVERRLPSLPSIVHDAIPSRASDDGDSSWR